MLKQSSIIHSIARHFIKRNPANPSLQRGSIEHFFAWVFIRYTNAFKRAPVHGAHCVSCAARFNRENFAIFCRGQCKGPKLNVPCPSFSTFSLYIGGREQRGNVIKWTRKYFSRKKESYRPCCCFLSFFFFFF